MTKDEFAEWLRHHRAAFVGLGRWLEEIPLETDFPHQPTRGDVLRTWMRILEDTQLEDAKAATDSMARGDDEEPMGFDRHPRAIRTIATRLRRLRLTATREPRPREERLGCLVCRDSGYVRVWHWRSLQAALEGSLGGAGTLYTMAVPCTCQAGDALAATTAKLRGGDNPAEWRFNDQRYLPAPVFLDDPQAQDDLRAFAHALRDLAAQSRRHDEFERFSGGYQYA